MKSKKRKRMGALLILFGLITIGIILFLQHPLFGKKPSGERLERLEKSKYYKNGQFHNLSHTPAFAEDASYFDALKELLFSKVKHTKPLDSIPHIKTDLSKLSTTDDFLIWFGHSSYLIQADQKRFLIDPVLTKNASPIYSTNNAFKGADTYHYDLLPPIDFLILTHDHYDHLDYTTLKKLKDKTKAVVCPLGVGEHLEYWGFPAKNIIELDWFENASLDKNIQITATPARHFSGRGFKRNNTLWASYVFQSKNLKLYLGGDSGYDHHFKEIGTKFGPFDLAILENGQYNYKWKYIHMFPEEVVKAAKDLQTKSFFPVHSSKFKLANHPWKEPLEKVTAFSKNEPDLRLITPKIGEIVYLNQTSQTFENWWETIE